MTDHTIRILEKQREDLVVRVLKKHEEMEASRSFTERILAGISELFLLLDHEFRVIQTNREFVQRTGFAAGDDRRLALDDLVVRRSEFDAHLAALRARGLDSSNTPAVLRGVLEAFLEERVLVLEARRRGLIAPGATPEEE